MQQTDEQLLIGIRDGDNEAFRALISAKERALYSVAFGILRNRQDAEDAVYDAFEELCVKAHTIRNASALTAWLMTTVKRRAFDILRKNSRTVADDELLFSASTHPDYAEAVHIGECLKQLPPEQFEALSLHSYGLKLREISAIVKSPVTTVWSTLKKAQANFKKLYEK